MCNTIVDSLYPVSTQHSSLSTQLHHRHSNGISGHCQQCQASVEFLGNQFPVVGIVSVSITVVCRVWRPASLGTGPYPVPTSPRRQREQYLYIVLYISILECVISQYLYLYISMTASQQAACRPTKYICPSAGGWSYLTTVTLHTPHRLCQCLSGPDV